MKLMISPLAEQDIEAIGDYIALDSPQRAARFVRTLYQQCQQIIASPQAWRLRAELGEGIRCCVYQRYLIIYSADEETVRIERVLHGARDIAALTRQ